MSDINVGNYNLPTKIIKKMRSRLDDTRNTGLEHNFIFCVPKGSDKIKDFLHTRGKSGSIYHFTNECPKGEKYVGNYHTHHNEGDIMSSQDVLSSCKDKVSCIGSDLTGDITCYTRKLHPVKSKDRVLRKTCENEIKPIISCPVHSMDTNDEIDKISDKYFSKTKIKKDYILSDEEDEFDLVEVQD